MATDATIDTRNGNVQQPKSEIFYAQKYDSQDRNSDKTFEVFDNDELEDSVSRRLR